MRDTQVPVYDTYLALFTADPTDTGSTANAVTGATTTITIFDPDDNKVVDNASMTDAGSGEYTYTIASDTLAQNDAVYQARIEADTGSEQRTTEVPIKVEKDRT